MTIDLQIFQTVVKMPESLKQEILHNAKYLLEKHAKTESSPEQFEQTHVRCAMHSTLFCRVHRCQIFDG